MTVREFNNGLAMRITGFVGTMWCAYLFAAISLSSLPSVIESHSLPVLISWIAQTFLQLVLLSVIMVGQNIQSAKADDIHTELKKHHHLLSELHASHFGGKHDEIS